MSELNTLLRSISLMDMDYDGRIQDLFHMSLFSVAERIDVREGNGKLIEKSAFIGKMRLLIDYERGARDESDCVGNDGVIDHIRDRLGEDMPLAKALVYYKILEEIAMKSDDDDVWKPAMMEIGNTLIEEPLLADSGNWKAILAAECIRRIYENCDGEKSRFALNIVLVKKCRLATDIFSEGLFRRHPGNERAVGMTLSAFKDEDILLAALFARSGCTLVCSQVFFDRLSERIERLDPENAKNSLAFIRNKQSDYESSPIIQHLLEGIAQMFDISGVTLPYPGYKDTPNRYGLPVPRFDQMSMHRAAFRSLPRIGGARALSLMAQGIGQLIVPNILLTPHGPKCEPDIMDSLPDISEALIGLSSQNGIRSGNSCLLSSIVLGYPAAADPLSQQNGSFISISPVLIKVAMGAEWAGAGDAPLSLCACQAVLQGLMTDVRQDGSSDNPRIIERNIRAMRDAHKSVFTSIDDSDIRKMKEFLKELSRKGMSGKLENGTRNGSGSIRPGSIRPGSIRPARIS